jgi:hypothetical protein
MSRLKTPFGNNNKEHLSKAIGIQILQHLYKAFSGLGKMKM